MLSRVGVLPCRNSSSHYVIQPHSPAGVPLMSMSNGSPPMQEIAQDLCLQLLFGLPPCSGSDTTRGHAFVRQITWKRRGASLALIYYTRISPVLNQKYTPTRLANLVTPIEHAQIRWSWFSSNEQKGPCLFLSHTDTRFQHTVENVNQITLN